MDKKGEEEKKTTRKKKVKEKWRNEGKKQKTKR